MAYSGYNSSLLFLSFLLFRYNNSKTEMNEWTFDELFYLLQIQETQVLPEVSRSVTRALGVTATKFAVSKDKAVTVTLSGVICQLFSM